MPSSKKQKLSQEEKTRRRMKSHTTKEAFNHGICKAQWNRANTQSYSAFNNSNARASLASIEYNVKKQRESRLKQNET